MVSYQYTRLVSLHRLLTYYLFSDYRVNTYANVITYTTFATYDFTEYSPLINYSDYLITYDNDIYMFIPTTCLYGVYGDYSLTGHAVHRDFLATGYTKFIYTVHEDDGNSAITEYNFTLSDDLVFPDVLEPEPDPLSDTDCYNNCKFRVIGAYEFTYTDGSPESYVYHVVRFNSCTGLFYAPDVGYRLPSSDVYIDGILVSKYVRLYIRDYTIEELNNEIDNTVLQLRIACLGLIPTTCCLLVCCEPDKYYLI